MLKEKKNLDHGTRTDAPKPLDGWIKNHHHQPTHQEPKRVTGTPDLRLQALLRYCSDGTRRRKCGRSSRSPYSPGKRAAAAATAADLRFGAEERLEKASKIFGRGRKKEREREKSLSSEPPTLPLPGGPHTSPPQPPCGPRASASRAPRGASQPDGSSRTGSRASSFLFRVPTPSR